MSGRTAWFPKDAAWHRRGRVVELGQDHGPAGPLVADWLMCEARSQNPPRTGDGSLKAGYAAVAHGCFLESVDQARRIVASCVEVGLLDDFGDLDGRTFEARISGWDADVNQPLEATRKAKARAAAEAGTDVDSVGHHGTNGAEVAEVPERPSASPTRQDKTEEKTSVEPSRLDEAATVRGLFAYWQERCHHPQAKLTSDRRSKILARLRDGYTAEQIRSAIDGAAVGAYVDERGKRHDDIELICRNGSKLESFIDRAGGKTARNGSSSIEDTVAFLNGRPGGDAA